MKCTRCNKGQLKPAYITERLPGHSCNHCHGNWLYLSDYLTWLDKQTGDSLNAAETINLEEEKHEVMLCPETGSIMLKYRISANTDHRVDLSPSVNGIWLDKGEWELLEYEGISLQLNSIFTEPWQRHIRENRTHEVLDNMYREQFGEEDYLKLQEIKTWLDTKPDKHRLLAYLLARNPYSISE